MIVAAHQGSALRKFGHKGGICWRHRGFNFVRPRIFWGAGVDSTTVVPFDNPSVRVFACPEDRFAAHVACALLSGARILVWAVCGSPLSAE